MLIQLSVFYRNDTPNGFGVTLTNDFINLKVIESLMTEALDTWERKSGMSRSEFIRETRCQIEDLIPIAKTNDIHALLILIADIYVLEQLGGMASNEWNGCQFVYLD